MGSYITTDDARNHLRDDLTALYDLPDQQDDLDADIAAVEALVDSYVGKRYEVPVTDAGALTVVKPIALDLLAERAYTLHGSGPELPGKIVKAADRARALLKDISTNAVTLAGATGLTERSSGGADSIIVEGNDPIFTRDDMEGF